MSSQKIPSTVDTSPALTAIEINKLLADIENPVILEIGANTGSTTAEMIAAIPNAVIHSFEPDPVCISSFKSLHSRDPRIFLHETAIGNVNGEINFFRASNGASGSIKKPKEHIKLFPEVSFDGGWVCKIARLDDFCSENGIDRVDFIWTDVQGAEGDLIFGGLNTIKRAKYFYTEYCEYELYEGQLGLAKIFDLLGPDFGISRRFHWDCLFQNNSR